MAGFCEGTLANLFFGNEQRASRLLIRILRLVSHERLVALIDERSDINDERGAHVGVEAGVDDLERTVRRSFRFDLGQSGEKTGFIAESGDDGMIGMTRLPVGKDDNTRPDLA